MGTPHQETDLIMVCTSDLSGQMRGKAIPRRAIKKRSEIGVGWTPTNIFITAFGPIAPSPWGALGDLMLRPDFSTQVDLPLLEWGMNESFVIGDILTLEEKPWEGCLRGQLKSAIEQLKNEHGLTLNASFEHEFYYSGSQEQPGLGYALRAYRRLGEFPNRLMAVLDQAKLGIDTFMPEYGPGQCEVTIDPQPALQAADQAVILRELTRSVARSLEARASFCPMLDPQGVGNGVHVHFSLQDLEGQPCSYDPKRKHGVSQQAGAFIAGILNHLPEFIALTASSVPSYFRLTPHRWSAAFNNFGIQDREAAVRLCPVFGKKQNLAQKFHFEYRVADATASPYLVLKALIQAGISGLAHQKPTPFATETDLSLVSAETLATWGCQRLPTTLEEALQRLITSSWVAQHFSNTFIDAFERHKRTELELMEGLSKQEICDKYAVAY